MSMSSRALKRLRKLYVIVLQHMRRLQWLLEHGIRRATDQGRSALATLEAFEPRLLLSGGLDDQQQMSNYFGEWDWGGIQLTTQASENAGQTELCITFAPTDPEHWGFDSFDVNWADGTSSEHHVIDSEIDGSSQIHCYHTYADSGEYYAWLTPIGLSASPNFIIDVPNTAPMLTGVTMSGPAVAGERIDFTAWAEDPSPLDKQNMAYCWSVTKNGGNPIDNCVYYGNNTYSYIPAGPGEYSVEVHLRDEDSFGMEYSESSYRSFSINPPEATIRAMDGSEDGQKGCFEITLSNGNNPNGTYVYFNTSETATFDVDYTTDNPDQQDWRHWFPPGQTSQIITVTPTPDLELEGDETITLSLREAPDYEYLTGSSGSATVTIHDVPHPAMGLMAIGDDGSVALSWAAVPGATSYYIYQGNQDTHEYGLAPVAEVDGATTNFDVQNLQAGTEFSFLIMAVVDGNECGSQNEATAWTKAAGACLMAEWQDDPTRAKITWSPPDGRSWSMMGVTGLQIYRSTMRGQLGDLLTPDTGISVEDAFWADTCLDDRYTYYYTAIVENDAGWGSPDLNDQCCLEGRQWADGQLGYSLDDTADIIHLYWNEFGNANYYDLYRDGELLQGGLVQLSYDDEGVVKGHVYIYQVKAVYGDLIVRETPSNVLQVCIPLYADYSLISNAANVIHENPPTTEPWFVPVCWDFVRLVGNVTLPTYYPYPPGYESWSWDNYGRIWRGDCAYSLLPSAHSSFGGFTMQWWWRNAPIDGQYVGGQYNLSVGNGLTIVSGSLDETGYIGNGYETPYLGWIDLVADGTVINTAIPVTMTLTSSDGLLTDSMTYNFKAVDNIGIEIDSQGFVVNDALGDDDIPAYLDGLNLDGIPGNADDYSEVEDALGTVSLYIPEWLQKDKCTISFDYIGGAGGPLRLWQERCVGGLIVPGEYYLLSQIDEHLKLEADLAGDYTLCVTVNNCSDDGPATLTEYVEFTVADTPPETRVYVEELWCELNNEDLDDNGSIDYQDSLDESQPPDIERNRITVLPNATVTLEAGSVLRVWTESAGNYTVVSSGLTTGESETKALYLEGLAPGVQTITVTLDSAIYTYHVHVVDVNLAVDSDNDDGFDVPEQTPEEDLLELHSGEPGKIIPVNDGDIDQDGIPDYLDGLNLDGVTDSTGDSTDDYYVMQDGSPVDVHFVPVVVSLSGEIDLTKASLIIDYGSSCLRLWTRPEGAANDNRRSLVPVQDADPNDGLGHLVQSGYVYEGDDLAALGIGDLSRSITLYAEGIQGGPIGCDLRIVAKVYPDGIQYYDSPDNLQPYGWTITDEVRVTTEVGTLEAEKVVVVNDSDLDNDGIVDLADFDVQNKMFNPVTIRLPRWANPATATITFNYDASDPAGVSGDAPAVNGSLRLWLNDDWSHDPLPLGTEAGEFIESGVGYTIADFGCSWFTDGSQWIKLYMEAVKATPDGSPLTISWSVDPDGAGEVPAFALQSAHVAVLQDSVFGSCSGVVNTDGSVSFSETDLAFAGLKAPWSMTRTYTTQPGWPAASIGNNFYDWPQLLDTGPTVVVFNGGSALYFDQLDLTPNEYKGRFGVLSKLEWVGLYFKLTDPAGNIMKFSEQGNFFGYETPSGGEVTIERPPGDDNHEYLLQRDFSGRYRELYIYEKFASGPHKGMIKSVLVKREDCGTSGASIVTTPTDQWTILGEVKYDYYGTGDTNGNLNDLKLVQTFDGKGVLQGASCYRYAIKASRLEPSRITSIVDTAGYFRMKEAGLDPLTDDTGAYEAYFLGYNASTGKVSTQWIRGAGGGSLWQDTSAAYSYGYAQSSFSDIDPNSWMWKATETAPSGAVNTVYMNYAGQVMGAVVEANGLVYDSYTHYEKQGRVDVTADTNAVEAISEGLSDLVGATEGQNLRWDNISNNQGVVTVCTYGQSGTQGDAPGYLKSVSIRHGDDPSSQKLLEEYQYVCQQGVYLVETQTSHNYITDGGGDIVNHFTYGMTGRMPTTITATLPSTTANHGKAETTATSVFDPRGRASGGIDGDGFTQSITYDPVKGSVQTAGVSSGSKTILTRILDSDAYGRPKAGTDANGNVVTYEYADFLTDSFGGIYSEVRVLQSGAPTSVTRTNYSAGVIDVYTEDSSGKLLSLTRSWLDKAGRTRIVDQYVSFGQGAAQKSYANLYAAIYDSQSPDSPSLGELVHQDTEATEGIAFYYRTLYDFDFSGNLYQMINAVGTITQYVFDALGRVKETYVGTSMSNLQIISSQEYDCGQAGLGNVTKSTQYTSSGQRVTEYYYDWRGRLTATRTGVGTDPSLHAPIICSYLDTLGRVYKQETWDGAGVTITRVKEDGGTAEAEAPVASPSPTVLSRTDYMFDARGQVWRTNSYLYEGVYDNNGQMTGVNPVGSRPSDNWYDNRGNMLAAITAGEAVQKSIYDFAGRLALSYVTDNAGGDGNNDGYSVAGDHVLSQTEYTYDDNGNVIFTITRERNHDFESMGPLGTGTSRAYYSAYWYDNLDRLIQATDFGTNGGVAMTSRPTDRMVFSGDGRADFNLYLTTKYAYSADGMAMDTTDPRGIITHKEFDALGRTIKTIENYDASNPNPTRGKNRTVIYKHDGLGHVIEQSQILPVGSSTTTYTYGQDDAELHSNDVLSSESIANLDGSHSVITYQYNRQGQIISKVEASVTHIYGYDALGRQVSDELQGQWSSTDLWKYTTGYDRFGRAAVYTSYYFFGGPASQIVREYNAYGQVTAEFQQKGAIVTSSSPAVWYGYIADRLVSISYPLTGRVINYSYGDTGTINNRIGRIEAITEGGQVIESYKYTGTGTIVQRSMPQRGVTLSYIEQTGDSLHYHDSGDGDKYTGLDRFGRVIDQFWFYTDPETGAKTTLERYQYGYDPDGNRLYELNLVNGDFSELYGPYDKLNRMTQAFQGNIIMDAPGTMPTGDCGFTMAWNYDAQSKCTNSHSTFVEDNGNVTQTEGMMHRHMTYDAWNRLLKTEVLEPPAVGGGPADLVSTETYAYDALGRLIEQTSIADVDSPVPVVRSVIYSTGWQALEESVSANGGPADTYDNVWSLSYIDAMVFQEKKGPSGNVLSRTYALQDANWNVTAIVDSAADLSDASNVTARFTYDPYGQVTKLAGSWSEHPAAGFIDWRYYHQGGYYSDQFGGAKLYYFRNRFYDPLTQQWLQRDPARDGLNWREYEGSAPSEHTDPQGLSAFLEVVGGWVTAQVDGAIGIIKASSPIYHGYNFCKSTSAGFSAYDSSRQRGIGIWDSAEDASWAFRKADPQAGNVIMEYDAWKARGEDEFTAFSRAYVSNTPGLNIAPHIITTISGRSTRPYDYWQKVSWYEWAYSTSTTTQYASTAFLPFLRGKLGGRSLGNTQVFSRVSPTELPPTLAERAFMKYQQFYDEGYKIGLRAQSDGRLKPPPGITSEMHLGRFVDKYARGKMTKWLQSLEIAEEADDLIRINRRLYDPCGSGDYRVPDVRIPLNRTILDGTISPSKTISTPQMIDFRAYSCGDHIIVVRPSVVPGGGSYGLIFP